MVRHANISSECPVSLNEPPLEETFHDLLSGAPLPFTITEPPEQGESRPTPSRPAGAPRNLAGAGCEPPPAVKSRRSRQGRSARGGGRGEAEPTRQITVALPVRHWRLLRDEAARRRISIAALCRCSLRPLFQRLDEKRSDEIDDES